MVGVCSSTTTSAAAAAVLLLLLCVDSCDFCADSVLLFSHLGPFLYSRIPPVVNGPFRLDSCGPSFYRQSSRFYSFRALPRGGWCQGVLLYGSRKSVGSSGLRRFLASKACFTRDEPSSTRVGGVGLSRKPPKLRSWRCTQPRAAKATAGVAVVGKTASIMRATAVV